MKRLFSILFASSLVGLVSVSAEATLTTIGTASYGSQSYNLIYDEIPGLVWLDYSNALDVWQNQMIWVISLNSPGMLTYNINSAYTVTWGVEGFRLPKVVDSGAPGCNWAYSGTDCGFNVDTSTGEMAHLYYDELGNKAYSDLNGVYPQPGWGLVNKGPFANLLPNIYWSNTEYAPNINNAWGFDFVNGGGQNADNKNSHWYAMAVRSGNVVPTPVPEPGTIALIGSGLIGFGLIKFRKRFR